MKPLTIEELKALEVGDWVWVIDKDYEEQGNYVSILDVAISWLETDSINGVEAFYWEDYGTKWLAYKNKEQAEAEEYKMYEEKSWGWMVSKYIPAHYKPWFTADTKAEAERRLAELKGE